MRFSGDDTSAFHKRSIIVFCLASSTIEVQQHEHYLEVAMLSYIPHLLLLFAMSALIGCGLQSTSTPTTYLAATSITDTTVPARSLPTRISATAVALQPTSVPASSATPLPIVTPAVELVSK